MPRRRSNKPIRKRPPGEVTQLVLQAFRENPGASAVTLGEITCTAASSVTQILKKHGLSTKKPKLSDDEIRRRKVAGVAKKLAQIDSDPLAREERLAARRGYERRRKAKATPEEMERERERCRVKQRRKRAELRAKADAATTLIEQIPKYVPRTTEQIIHDYQVRQAARARQHVGWVQAKREWEEDWKMKLHAENSGMAAKV